jgi:hypothetical protein
MNLILVAVQLLVAGVSASVCGLVPGECGGPAAPPPVAPHHPAAAHHRRRHSSSGTEHCCGGCPYKRGPHRAKLLGQLYIDALIADNEVQVQSLQIPNMPSEQYNLCWDSSQCCKSPYPFNQLYSLFSQGSRPYQLTPVEFVEELADHSVIVQTTILSYSDASLISYSWQVQMKWSWMPDCEMKLSMVVGVDVPCIGKAGFGSQAPFPVTSVCSKDCTQGHIYTATTLTTVVSTSTVTSTPVLKDGVSISSADNRVGRLTEPTPSAR